MTPQFILLHRPGPTWKDGVPFLEQPGLQGHVDHFREIVAQGVVLAAGPFLDAAAGGMVLFRPGVAESRVLEIARSDPTVLSGLLEFELRPWFSAPWAGVLSSGAG